MEPAGVLRHEQRTHGGKLRSVCPVCFKRETQTVNADHDGCADDIVKWIADCCIVDKDYKKVGETSVDKAGIRTLKPKEYLDGEVVFIVMNDLKADGLKLSTLTPGFMTHYFEAESKLNIAATMGGTIDEKQASNAGELYNGKC
jgi:hypothetical protein